MANHRVSVKESEKTDKYLDLTKEPKKQNKTKQKLLNMEGTVIPTIVGALETIPKEANETGDQRENRNYQDYSPVKINLNT